MIKALRRLFAGPNSHVRVSIPKPLRQLTNGANIVESYGTTVNEVLLALDEQYPGMSRRLFYENGKLRTYIHFYVNGEDIRFLQDKETPVKPGEEVSIVPAIAGG